MLAHLLLAAAVLLPVQDEDRVRDLIRQLGSEAYDEREAAEKALMEIGEPALAQLEKAAESDDLEVRDRAIRVLEHVRKGPSPAPPKEEEAPPPRRPGFGSSSMMIRVSGDDGYLLHVANGRVTLRLDRNGESYSAESAEEFRKKYPALYKQYVEKHAGTTGVRARARTPRSPAKPLEDQLEQLRKLLENLDEWMRGLDENPDLDWFEEWMKSFERERRDLKDRQKEWAEKFRRDMDKSIPTRKMEGEEGGNLGFLIGPIKAEEARAAGIPEGEGVKVLEVYPDSPAGDLGLKKGDLLHKVNGLAVKNAVQTRTRMASGLRGKDLTVEVLRDGERTTLPEPKD